VRCIYGTIVAVKKQQYYKLQKCIFVALGIQHAFCRLHTVISDQSGSSIFSTFPHEGHDFLRVERERRGE
jgi:hypothetical protein